MSKGGNLNYNKIAENYLSLVDDKAIHKFYERPNLLSLLPENISNTSVLDLGCGSGWYTGELLKRGARVTAIDNCQAMVDYTEKKYGTQANIQLMDLEQPLDTFDSAQYDIIIAPLVVHYIKDWGPLFKELARVLKPGGSICLSTHQPQSEYFLLKLDNYYEKKMIQETWDGIGEVKWYHHTLEELFNSMISAGLNITKILEPQPKPEMEAAAPEMYKNIITDPWFLFVNAKKVA